MGGLWHDHIQTNRTEKTPQFQEFQDFRFGSLGTQWQLDATLVAKHRKYYKGGRWWLPLSSGRGESCEFMYAHVSFMHQKCLDYALTNLLFGLCKSMWIIDPFITHFNLHPGVPTHPNTLEMLQIRGRTPIPFFSHCFHLWIYSQVC